ncbi:Bug family tripartite tricarboxylate transporter substrate binding protein [Microvirga massiliensis]|uniref:Bug family tripartite tricarboxylate transporter substrate binding protein n=1 Tax=Microvirga massiliensis TaxID=1033741 RepID=UPI00065FCDB4|nr:tripartite tricarboxylate transporter substrate-binding protein [Microvirga massiliensis]
MVVPYAPGSGTDVLGRIIAARLAEVLGVSVVVENVGGSGGMAGTARVAKAPSDGYQIVIGNVGTHAHNQTLYRTPAYRADVDFEPVGLVADLAPILIARADFPAATLEEFIAYVRQNDSKINYGSAGLGSASQLACALLNAKAGLNVTHVPYRGAPQAMQDLVAGRIDYQCALLPSPLPQIQNGQVKPIAVLDIRRSGVVPEVPTATEAGLPGIEASAWHALFVPRGTPQEVVVKLNQALAAALDTPSVREQLERQGAVAPPLERRSPDYLRTFMKSEIDRWGAMIRELNIEIN